MSSNGAYEYKRQGLAPLNFFGLKINVLVPEKLLVEKFFWSKIFSAEIIIVEKNWVQISVKKNFVYKKFFGFEIVVWRNL